MNTKNSVSITQVSYEMVQKGKKAIYLVLKKKSFIDEILESLQEEVEKRFMNFLNKKREEMNRLKPDNPDEFFKCYLLRALIKILDKMFKEYHINLSDKDKNILKDIFENECPLEK